MELAFAAPLWAWAFATLAVPILIHFFASRWQQPRRFAALRFLLPAAEQGRARRISDWLLLLLRLLLLALIVLALMMPTLVRTVARTETLHIAHPGLAKTDEEVAAANTAWLCHDGQLVRQRCANDAAVFIDSLQQLATARPDVASVIAQVPATVTVPSLALPPLPIDVQWQPEGDDTASGVTTRTVSASAEYAPLFTAANAVEGVPHWRFVTENLAADLSIGNPEANAAVLWHQKALPWQERSSALESPHQPQPAFFVSGTQLHLRSEPAAVLRENPARLALLLTQTENWLARGQSPWRQPVSALRSWSVPSPIGKQELPLQSWLFFAGLLVLMLERGFVHVRR